MRFFTAFRMTMLRYTPVGMTFKKETPHCHSDRSAESTKRSESLKMRLMPRPSACVRVIMLEVENKKQTETSVCINFKKCWAHSLKHGTGAETK